MTECSGRMPALVDEIEANVALTGSHADLEAGDKGRQNIPAAAAAIHSGGKRRGQSWSACVVGRTEMHVVVIETVRKRAVHQCDRCRGAGVAVERQGVSPT